MKFEEAFKHMREGNKITRKSWSLILGCPQYYCIRNGKVMFYSGIEFYEYISLKDSLAEDWEVIGKNEEQ